MMASLPSGSCAAEYPEDEQSETTASTLAADQPAYEYDFIEQPSQDFYCPVTLELLRDPQQTTCCGNHLSQEAAVRLQHEGKPCPMCKDPNLTTVPDKFHGRRVNEVQVRCPYKANGCQWVGPVSNFDKHCNSCPKRPWICEYCNFKATNEAGVNDHLPACTKYPEPCPNSCEIGTVERCNLENHLQECPLQLVECKLHEIGCSVRVPRKDLERHMEESGQQHLVAMSLLNLQLTRELHQKMEEKDRLITELREQLEQQGRDMKKQIVDTQKQLGDVQKQLQQHSRDVQEQLLVVEQRVKAQVNLALRASNVFEFTITEFSVKKDMDFDWHSNAFYTHPHGYKFRLNIETKGNDTAKGTHVSAYLQLMKDLDGRYSGRLLLLNQLGDSAHHVVGFKRKLEKNYNTISQHFIPHSQLGYNAARNTQYLKDDCLHFRLYLNVWEEKV